jgi:hypothetical protein
MPSLPELRQRITGSVAENWHVIPQDGPTYRDRFAVTMGPMATHMEADTHLYVAVFEADVDLTLAWGMEFDFAWIDGRQRDTRKFDWANAFPDESVSVSIADVFWRGSLIDRIHYVLVDGARGLLPWAREYDELKTSRYEYDFARLLNDLSGHREFDHYFETAGFRIE